MVKLIIGVKGTGKTKTLIEMVHTALDHSKGKVVCIEKSNKLRYDINYRCRLVEADEYMVASDHDITDLFIDSALKIAQDDMPAFEKLVKELDVLSAKYTFNCVITASCAVEDCPNALKSYTLSKKLYEGPDRDGRVLLLCGKRDLSA